MNACNLRTWEMESGDPDIKGSLGYIRFEGSLGYKTVFGRKVN